MKMMLHNILEEFNIGEMLTIICEKISKIFI